MKETKFTRRTLLKTGALASTVAALPGGLTSAHAKPEAKPSGLLNKGGNNFTFRAITESIHHPTWYLDKGNPAASKSFWDKANWERVFKVSAEMDYNAVIYFTNPWLVHQWQTFLIRHEKYPEAREMPEEEQEKVIEQARWIFAKAKEFGLNNFLYNMCIVTTQPFARAHGLDKDMPVSDTVDWRHNYQHKVPGGPTYDKMIHWGVRNELTRDFTIAAVEELFKIYDDLDGFAGTMGEALPGNRCTWYKEAYVPGMKNSGRNPIFIMTPWMMPLDEFKMHISPKEVYDNTWLCVSHNGEIISDPEPYPIIERWPKETGLPTILQYVIHNLGAPPWDPPKFAHEMIHETMKVENCVGYHLHFTGQHLLNQHRLFGRAIGRYGKVKEEYSEDPWIDVLEEDYGDREAARHFLNACNASGRITPMMNQLAWCPHDGRCTRPLFLKYWHFTDQDSNYSYFTSPGKGLTLLPLRHYAKTVAERGESYRDNDGSDTTKRAAQELIWGHIDFQVTPEAHMRKVRASGEECAREARAALKTVKKNRKKAEELANWMEAYRMLSEYYQAKVLAAVSAVIYHHNNKPEERTKAEALADRVVELYEEAANFMWEKIDNKQGNIKGGWWDEKRDLPGLIEMEKEERKQFASLFKWPEAEVIEERAKLGTTEQDKEAQE